MDELFMFALNATGNASSPTPSSPKVHGQEFCGREGFVRGRRRCLSVYRDTKMTLLFVGSFVREPPRRLFPRSVPRSLLLLLLLLLVLLLRRRLTSSCFIVSSAPFLMASCLLAV